MKHSRIKASVAALAVAALIGLSACSGGDDGLSKADEEALQAELAAAEEAKRQAEAAAAEAERRRQAEEAARRQAEADAAAAERERAAEAERRAAEEKQRLAAEAAAAEAERDRREAEQAANRVEAGLALTGLANVTADTPVVVGTVAVTPRYRQTATVTTIPAVDFASKRHSSSGRWSITTLSNDDRTNKDDLVVYSDLGGPTRMLITDITGYTATFAEVSGTNNIRAMLTGATHPIASSQFPRGGGRKTFEHTIDTTDDDTDTPDTTRFSGRYDGASGTFECTGTCTVKHQGGSSYNLEAGDWTFTTSKTARVPVDDDSYLYFGWWKREAKPTGALSFAMFSGGTHEVAGTTAALTGTATYTGPAAGQYAVYQPAGDDSGAGSFTARAALTANFGAVGSEGTVSGRITNFSNASDWSVTLKSADIATGTITDGDVSWTIGSSTEDGGTWDAQFFSDVDASPAYPEGVAGTFDAQFGSVGRLIGAFGAHCPTSTCPRN